MGRLVGHKLAGRPSHTLLKLAVMNSWKVIIVEQREKQLTLLFGKRAPGLGQQLHAAR